MVQGFKKRTFLSLETLNPRILEPYDRHMQNVSLADGHERAALLRRAAALALITIFYNVLEGIVSVFFGLEDETIALMGFGLDSFVEVVSGMGIYHMVRRTSRNGREDPDRFERTALRITGSAFYMLAAGLTLTAVLNLVRGHAPETTFWGIVIASISILAMWALIHYKVKVGQRLGSEAVLADANCTKACLYLSVVLLLSSAGYELTGMGGMDSAGAVLIAWFSLREGKEAFEKAKGKQCACGNTCR
jgi:divalent metal cation (Fe/Co/Zn/Cd) transporter